MASQPESSEASSLFERLATNRAMSLFLPFIFGFSNASPSSNSEDPNQQTESTEGASRERVVLINPITQGMVVIDGNLSLETLIGGGIGSSSNGGPPPASKESIEAMPSVEVGEDEEGWGECAICLEEWEVGGVAKEMPCSHRFHQSCIEKWLSVRGTCPVCRYQMPAGEKDEGKKGGDEDEEGGQRRRRVGREVWVSFSFNGGRRSEGQNQAPSGARDGDHTEVQSV